MGERGISETLFFILVSFSQEFFRTMMTETKKQNIMIPDMQKYKHLLLRSLKEGIVQVGRNRFLSLTTIALGALIIFLLNFVFGVRYFVDLSLKDLESRADFSVQLRADYDAFQLGALTNELKMYDIDVQVFPADEFREFQLNPYINVRFRSLESVEEVLGLFKKARYSDVVGEWDSEGEKSFVTIVGKLLSLRKNTDSAANVLVLLFIGGGVLLMLNTFRIVLFSRKNEVFIARIVGADPPFIILPFLFEGIFLGFLSTLLGVVLFVFVLREIPNLPGGEIFLHLFESVFPLQILLSAVVGAVGAWIAVRKYLFGNFGA